MHARKQGLLEFLMQGPLNVTVKELDIQFIKTLDEKYRVRISSEKDLV